jgi:hypothetical protein
MLQRAMKYSVQLLTVILFSLIAIAASAQDKVEIDTQDVKSWLERNWIWVAAGIVLIVLIALIGRGNRTARRTTTLDGGERKTTTVVKDAAGNVQSVTTTEEKL